MQASRGWSPQWPPIPSGAPMCFPPSQTPPEVSCLHREARWDLTTTDPEDWTADDMRRWLKAVCVMLNIFLLLLTATTARAHAKWECDAGRVTGASQSKLAHSAQVGPGSMIAMIGWACLHLPKRHSDIQSFKFASNFLYARRDVFCVEVQSFVQDPKFHKS
jgi:hypothetical protein